MIATQNIIQVLKEWRNKITSSTMYDAKQKTALLNALGNKIKSNEPKTERPTHI